MFQGMKYVYEVYKEKSFSKAAASLFISQPSLSANVKRIENRMARMITGVPPFLTFVRFLLVLGMLICILSSHHYGSF